jgi:hypothetical protein
MGLYLPTKHQPCMCARPDKCLQCMIQCNVSLSCNPICIVFRPPFNSSPTHKCTLTVRTQKSQSCDSAAANKLIHCFQWVSAVHHQPQINSDSLNRDHCISATFLGDLYSVASMAAVMQYIFEQPQRTQHYLACASEESYMRC